MKLTALSDARLLVAQIVGETESAGGRKSALLDETYRKFMRAPGKYPQRMLLEQLEYLYEVITTADFMSSIEAFSRFEELRVELDGHIAAVRQLIADR